MGHMMPMDHNSLTSNRPPGSLQFIALELAICAAYVLYRFVELPSRSLAARISYGKAR
jgi:peptidoglycan/LPS O-acetylase OafA/YrhL